MSKTRINLTVDLDVALMLKAQPEINISSAVNDFLRELTRIDDVRGEESELLDQQKLLKEKLFAVQDQLTKTSAQIIAVRTSKEKAFKKQIEAHDDFVRSGIMRTIK